MVLNSDSCQRNLWILQINENHKCGPYNDDRIHTFLLMKESESMKYLIYAVLLMATFIASLCDAEIHNITHPQPKCGGKEKASSILDVAKDFINKAKNLYPECIDDDLNCGKKEKSLAFLEVASNLISSAKKTFPTCPEHKCPEPDCPAPDCPEPECPKPECPEQTKPIDCSEVLRNGQKESGVYAIWPKSNIFSGKPLSVYCDMHTDEGGWTVIQRRGNFSTPKDYFYKDWESYKIGFGDIKEEFWLGNDNIHTISNQGHTTIRFDLEDAAGVTGYAHYDTFRIEDEISQYTLHINGYKGTVGDSMHDHNNMKFSTKDRDNDRWTFGSCAKDKQGAWWYHACSTSSLNSLSMPGVKSAKGIRWEKWRKDVCLAGVEIKLRPQRI